MTTLTENDASADQKSTNETETNNDNDSTPANENPFKSEKKPPKRKKVKKMVQDEEEQNTNEEEQANVMPTPPPSKRQKKKEKQLQIAVRDKEKEIEKTIAYLTKWESNRDEWKYEEHSRRMQAVELANEEASLNLLKRIENQRRNLILFERQLYDREILMKMALIELDTQTNNITNKNYLHKIANGLNQQKLLDETELLATENQIRKQKLDLLINKCNSIHRCTYMTTNE